MQPLINKSKTL